MNQEVLQRYIERITQLRDSASGDLDEATLREIALEVGITEEELDLAATTSRSHHQRGQGFLRYHRFDDAIEELTEALALAPGNDEIRLDLAKAYVEKFRQTRHGSARRDAESLLRQCLARRADLDEAFELLNELESIAPAPPQSAQSPQASVILTISAALSVLGIAVVFLVVAAPPDEMAEHSSSAPLVVEAVPQTPPPPATPRVEVDIPREGDPEIEPIRQTAGGDFPIYLSPTERSEDLSLHIHQSTLNVYDDRAFFEVSGWIENGGSQEWETMEADLQIFDADQSQIGISRRVPMVQSFQVPLRPGDAAVFNTIVETTPAAREAMLEIIGGDRIPAASAYPQPRTVAVDLDDLPQGARPQLVVRERNASFRYFDLMDQNHFRGHFEVINAGPPIRDLKLTLDFLDAAGQVLDSSESIVTYRSAAPILEREMRLFGTVVSVPTAAQDYRIRVTAFR